jgi:formyltetrahydrofolate deformylase
VAGWIFERGGNIVHADQHNDAEFGVFFQRVEWMVGGGDADVEAAGFAAFARESLGMEVRVARRSHRSRVAIMVSQHAHACHELLLNWREGELPGDIVCLISNHSALQATVEDYGLPFHYTPITAETKGEVERQQCEILNAAGVELVVLARYMQILSDEFLRALAAPAINIHHSFLPAFVGADPYHRAYERGVKLIGATAHYVTEDLDAGPIIDQDVTRVSHRDEVEDLKRIGRDIERLVLARAVKAHVDDRVLLDGDRTIVF